MVDAIVRTVNKMGFFADVGPLSVFVSSHVSERYSMAVNVAIIGGCLLNAAIIAFSR